MNMKKRQRLYQVRVTGKNKEKEALPDVPMVSLKGYATTPSETKRMKEQAAQERANMRRELGIKNNASY